MSKKSVLVVASLAYDGIETPEDKVDMLLGELELTSVYHLEILVVITQSYLSLGKILKLKI